MQEIREAKDFFGTIDIGVLAVREDELKAIIDRCRALSIRELIVEGRQDYFLFDLALGRTPLGYDLIYRLAVARVTQQGSPYSQQRAHNMIEDFDPEWLMLVGIGGATPSDEFTLGDVVVAAELHDFSVRAAVFDKDTEYRPGGGRMAAAVENFIGLLSGRQNELGGWNEASEIGRTSPPVDAKDETKLYGADDAWKSKVSKRLSVHFPTVQSTRKPRITVRPFAGGNTLMKDDSLWREWQSHARQIEAVEMELAGIYVAAWTRKKVYPILVSKGISDVIGYDRDPDWTQYACDTAAAGALAMLRLRPFKPRQKPDLAPLIGLTIAEPPVARQITGYPAAMIGVMLKNNSDRAVRITEVWVKTLQQVTISDERATRLDPVPEFEKERLYDVPTAVGETLKVTKPIIIQSGSRDSVWINLRNPSVRNDVLGMRFGPSLFRVDLSLIVEDEFEFKVGTFVLDLYGGNPHGTVTAINFQNWLEINEIVDRQMLKDCMVGRYILAPETRDKIHAFLRRIGDAAS